MSYSKYNKHDMNHPLSGSEKRQVDFVDLAGCKIKINGTYIPAYLRGGISIREEDYKKHFSS